MKKVLFTLALLASFVPYGQAQIFTFDKMNLPAIEMEIGIYSEINVTAPIRVYYNLRNSEDGQYAIAELTTIGVENLASSLAKAWKIFDKWSKVCQERWLPVGDNLGSRLLMKRIPVSFSDQTIYFTKEGQWHSEKGVDMHADFFMDENGKCFFILQSDYMTSTNTIAESSVFGFSNIGGLLSFSGAYSSISVSHYCNGALLIFESEEEINSLINMMRKALKWKKEQKSSSNIFLN